MAVQTLRQLADEVAKDPGLAAEIRKDPAEAIAKLAGQIPDTKVYRLVVIFLGLVALVAAAGAVVLAMKGGADVPESLVALGSAAIGALAGLLAPSPAT